MLFTNLSLLNVSFVFLTQVREVSIWTELDEYMIIEVYIIVFLKRSMSLLYERG